MNAVTMVPTASVVLPNSSTSSCDQMTWYMSPAAPEAVKTATTRALPRRRGSPVAGRAGAGLQRLRTPLTDGIPYARRVDRAGGQIESTNATRLVRGVEVIEMRSILGPFWCLEDLVLDRCVHALHDHHAIPRAEYAEES